jgi:hypothetical protein
MAMKNKFQSRWFESSPFPLKYYLREVSIMWIRSQNKRQLSNVDSIWHTGGDNPNIYGGAGGECECLGTYKSEERALEVIDEIQYSIRVIEAGRLIAITDVSATEIRRLKDVLVFEMPKE